MSTQVQPPPAGTNRGDINNKINELLQKIEEEFDLGDFIERRKRRLSMDLTPAGTLMLLLPLHDLNERELSRTEVVQDQDEVVLDREEFQKSLHALLSTIAEAPAPADIESPQGQRPSAEESAGRFRSAISVIYGYWQRFCQIPPFCGKGIR